ncbi:hypothetical protein K227x_29590 [Rubripirellula lacrimiformis]|uniref:Uncharacterized protein n=1 Tax=Rubripirellula lacrimiformis TaxID=1930273 RepID=A0A517NBQ4_9BACT|nr:hypothetical protein K227x_29590 [Rubripirellula lacrimiformis]
MGGTPFCAAQQGTELFDCGHRGCPAGNLSLTNLGGFFGISSPAVAPRSAEPSFANLAGGSSGTSVDRL